MTGLTIRLPGVVYDDYLDPMATGMQAELGLGEPTIRKAGYGYRVTYEGVSPEVALELARYLDDRAWVARGNGEMDNHVHRVAMKSAEAIRKQAREAT